MRQITFCIETVSDLDTALDLACNNESLSIYPSILIQIFTSLNDNSLLDEAALFLQDKIENAIIVGTTTSGEISKGKASTNNTVISISCFEQAKLDHSFIQRNDKELINTALDNILQDKIEPLKGILVLATPMTLDCDYLIKNITRRATGIPVFGGGAGILDNSQTATIYHAGKATDTGAIIVTISGEDVSLYMDTFTGWVPFGPTLTVTKSSNNTIHEIDHKPAFFHYQHFFNLGTDNFFESAVSFPLLTKYKNSYIARSPIEVKEDGSLLFVTNIKEGEEVQFGYGNVNEIIQHVNESTQIMDNFYPQAIWLYSCGCRRLFLSKDVDSELQHFENIAPTAGFFSYGEFSNKDELEDVLNTALVSVGIREGKSNNINVSKSADSSPIEYGHLNQMKTLMNFISVVTTDLEEANRELKHMAEQDALTGIYNRRMFQEIISSEFSRCTRYERPLALIFFDIDHFKKVNDIYGHDVGDNTLVFIAYIVSQIVRSSDFFFRYGGEEFAVLLPETTQEEARFLAERIRMSIELDSNEIEMNTAAITSSFGISTMRIKQDTPDYFFKRADKALYRAKNTGRNKVIIYSE